MAIRNHFALLEQAGVLRGVGTGEPVPLEPVHLAPGEKPRFAERQ